jgi:BirA family biotin operon repressor/biotin-[acetyl-CoA-carboxylase] ligase
MKQEILSHLPASFPWRGNIHHFDTIGSTNTKAKEMAAAGAPHGTVLIADSQTAGRGRMGRSFHSPAGTGIYLSVILRPNCPARELLHLTCAVAVAAADGIQAATGLRPGIKWTNDLVFGRQKLGGILTELSVNPTGATEFAVVGIGINCGQKVGDFPPEIENIATSLHLSTGKPIDRAHVTAQILLALEKICGQLSNVEAMLDRYRKDCITIGQEISLVRGDEIRHGKALDVDMEGALVVEFSDGHIGNIASGEVSVRGMYGYV